MKHPHGRQRIEIHGFTIVELLIVIVASAFSRQLLLLRIMAWQHVPSMRTCVKI